MKKKLFLIIGVVVIIALVYGLSMYFKPHKNMLKQTAAYSLTANEILSEFEFDEATANDKFVDEVVEISGSIASVNSDNDQITIILETDNPISGVICEMDDLSNHDDSKFKEGENIKLKCLCTGFLMDVSMRRCVIVK